MTVQEFYATVRRLGLRPSSVPHVYLTVSGDVHSVPDATTLSPEQRGEVLDKLRERLGILPPEHVH